MLSCFKYINRGHVRSSTAILVFGRPFIKRFALCYRTVVLSVLSVCPGCNVGVLWPNDWTDEDETWHGGKFWPGPNCVRWGPSSPQRGTAPQFLAHVHCGQTAVWIKMPLSIEVGLGPGDFVLDGDPAPPNGGRSPSTQFSAHAYCGQMSGLIKMPLGMEIDFGLCDIVRRKTNSPQRRTAPNFRPVSIVAKRLDGSRC